MSAARGRAAVLALLACVSWLAAATCVHAETTPGDSLLHAYIRSLSDTTDVWFGATTAPLDTAGLDSALSALLAKPPGHRASSSARRNAKLGFDYSPALGFNRADGGQLGLASTLRAPVPGQFAGRAQYTTGTHDVLGEGSWAGLWRLPRARQHVSLKAAAGRWTEPFDRDRFDPFFVTLNAVVSGADRHQYLRRDGWLLTLRTRLDRANLYAGWRDQLESPLPYSTRWTLFGGAPELAFNVPAVFGRARELSLGGAAMLPGTRFRVEAKYWTSDPRMGSDFRYRRLVLNTGGDLSLGRHLALVPQAGYARLRGQVLPQEALYLGGVNNLRTLERNELAGTGRAFARADLVLVDELGALLHVPLPAFLPLQAAAFVATGSVWGRAVEAGFAAPTQRDWARRGEWLTEAGLGLSWRPGIPDPEYSLRCEYSVPVGADARMAKFTIAFQRLLSLSPGR